MCSASGYTSDINSLNDRVSAVTINELENNEKYDKSFVNRFDLDEYNNNNELSEIKNVLCETYKSQCAVISPHRRDIIEDTSAILEETFNINNSKIADVINISGGGSIHVGHVINITEQLVLNVESNQLETSNDRIRDYSRHFYMIDRMHWLAQPPVAKIDLCPSPAKYVIICHTATEEAFTQAENILMIRLLQTFHIESRGWADIGYNFCIGSDGNLYEGRGWCREGSHTVNYNKYSVGIGFIGCFLNHLPPKIALKRCQDLIAHGVEIGTIRPDYELIGHCQCRPFLSPGKTLFEEIKTWTNFNTNITNTNPCIYQS